MVSSQELTYQSQNQAGAKKPVLLIGKFERRAPGARNVCEDLAAQLMASGWPVLTTSDKLHRLPRLLDMLGTALLKRREYTVAQVDVYSGPAFFWAEAVCWALRSAGKPYVLTLHGGNLPAFARRWPGRVKNLLRTASVVTTPSRYLLEQMAQYRADLLLHPNPLDLSRYRFRLRQQPNPVMVWLRAFHEIYNPSLAPKVLSLLAPDFPDIRLTMIGPDKGDGSLRKMQRVAMDLDVRDRISLPGAVPNRAVPERLSEGDIFLNTTNVDNTPVSVLEAMACGLCLVSTSVGGIPYLLEHEHDALLVPPDDPAAMASAVGRILNEPGLAERLSRNARRKAEQFDWSFILPRWERILMRAMVKG